MAHAFKKRTLSKRGLTFWNATAKSNAMACAVGVCPCRFRMSAIIWKSFRLILSLLSIVYVVSTFTSKPLPNATVGLFVPVFCWFCFKVKRHALVAKTRRTVGRNEKLLFFLVHAYIISHPAAFVKRYFHLFTRQLPGCARWS